MCWSSRVITFCFDSKIQFQLFLLLYGGRFNGKTQWHIDVSFSLCPPCPSEWAQHGVSIQSSINLGETLFRITCQWITALTDCLHTCINHLSYPSFLTIFLGREKWKICQQNAIITVRIPLRWKKAKMFVTLMLFFGELKSQREK